MVLLDDIIEVFTVANDNGGLVRLVVVRDRCRIRATPVNGNLLRQPLGANRLGQKGRGRSPITSRRQQEVYREALLSTARYKFPLPFDARKSHPSASLSSPAGADDGTASQTPGYI